MKKMLAVVALIVCLCLSFWAGSSMQARQAQSQQEYRCRAQMDLAADKLETLKGRYGQEDMEAIISNIYAAYWSNPGGSLNGALHTLWNALLFDGEYVVGYEDALIEALNAQDGPQIEAVAYSIRADAAEDRQQTE